MKTLFKTVITLFLAFTMLSPALAVSEEGTDSTLTNLEDQRIERLEKELSLTIPAISDNPNHIITFKDPSEENVGVQLEIDGQGYKTVTSPYTLPSLGIGKHVLTFRFTDSEETQQTLEKTLTIIPRPPIIEAPETLSQSQLVFKGTSLAVSTVDLYMTSGTKQYREQVVVNNDGTWTHTFEDTFEYGIYNIVALTRKNGLASSYSETIVFEITKSGGNTVKTVKETPIHFTFQDMFKQNPQEIVSRNPDLAYLVGVSLLTGLVIAILFARIAHVRLSRNLENVFSNRLKKIENTSPKKEEKDDSKFLTLREKFERAGLKKEPVKNVEVEEVQDSKETETVEKEKVVSKEEFLKDFKKHDPDTKDGKEKKSKKEEKKEKRSSNLMNSINISLTSKPSKK